MEHQLLVTARFRPEILERILRVVRHRGFRVHAMNMKQQNNLVHLTLTVVSERSIDLLTTQLVKLPDVNSVERQSISQQLRA